MSTERDYVLGTHDEELARLGLQHRVWRPFALDCWYRAGITVGSRVMDVGAGPGFATADLAEVVGPSGQVIAVDRSARFVEAAGSLCERLGLSNVRLHELDLMVDPMPADGLDAVWCRWVASFVGAPRTLVEKISGSLRRGGVAAFHEYVDYATWRVVPRRPAFEEFVRQVMASWRDAGGDPDVAAAVVEHLTECGFTIRHAAPMIFCVRPRHYMWRWPSTFFEIGLARLLELKRVESDWVEWVRSEFRAAEAEPNTRMLTPMVLEIIAER